MLTPQDIALLLQRHEWAVQIAFSRRYREASPLIRMIVANLEIPTFDREYQTTIMWALLDAVAEAHQYADVQLVETPWTLVADVVAYGVQGKSPALTTAAIHQLEQGFATVGVRASVLYDLAGDGSTCCVVDPEVHDPEKVVALMKAPVVQQQGRIFIRR